MSFSLFARSSTGPSHPHVTSPLQPILPPNAPNNTPYAPNHSLGEKDGATTPCSASPSPCERAGSERFPSDFDDQTECLLDDGHTSCVGRAEERGSVELDDFDGFVYVNRLFDAEMERKMVLRYLDDLEGGRVWDTTLFRGLTPMHRRRRVRRSLTEELKTNNFCYGVNEASTAVCGFAIYRVPPLFLSSEYPQPLGVRVAESGSIDELRNVQGSKQLPFHHHDEDEVLDWVYIPPRAISPVEVEAEEDPAPEADEEYDPDSDYPEIPDEDEWSEESDEDI